MSQRVVRLIAAAGLPVQSPDFGIEWMRHMGHDKKWKAASSALSCSSNWVRP
jgi:hypothetical protein